MVLADWQRILEVGCWLKGEGFLVCGFRRLWRWRLEHLLGQLLAPKGFRIYPVGEKIVVSLFFRAEGDIGQNSPSVQFEVSAA